MNCKIIQDLLPLYRDEVCSQESRQAVDEHIQSCPHCAEVLREMGREENLDRETADVDREIDGRTAVYLCYTKNIKSNLTPLFSHAGRPESSGHLSIGNGLLLDTVKGAAVQIPSQDQIQEVYYLAGDYAALEDMGEAEFSAATDGAVLLWQRS